MEQTDLKERQRKSEAARDTLVAEMRKRAISPPPTPPPQQTVSDAERELNVRRINSTPPPAQYLKSYQMLREPWRNYPGLFY